MFRLDCAGGWLIWVMATRKCVFFSGRSSLCIRYLVALTITSWNHFYLSKQVYLCDTEYFSSADVPNMKCNRIVVKELIKGTTLCKRTFKDNDYGKKWSTLEFRRCQVVGQSFLVYGPIARIRRPAFYDQLFWPWSFDQVMNMTPLSFDVRPMK